jgi:hypothetical protein
MGKINEQKYKLVKNLLTKEELELLINYTKIMHRFNTSSFDREGQSNNADTCMYRDEVMESLLLSIQERIEKETNLKLYPTYSFWRMYTYGADLKEHIDRPSCEISVTITLYSDGTDWPIYMGTTPVSMGPGDGCIYEGCDIPHSRKEFTGDGQSQVFLHYVDANGKNKDYKFDKREGIGYPNLTENC